MIKGDVTVRSIIAVVLVLVAARVEAAVLTDVQGRVTVRTQESSRLVAGTREVEQGDVVITGPDGRGTVFYRNGCYQIIDANKTVVIDEALCPAYGQVDVSGVSRSKLANPGAVIGGIAAIGVTGGLIITSGDKKRPASP